MDVNNDNSCRLPGAVSVVCLKIALNENEPMATEIESTTNKTNKCREAVVGGY